MPIYRFQIAEQAESPPAELCELASDAAAHEHALARAAALIRERVACFRRGETWRMVVTDENGVTCCSIDLSGAPAPAHGSHSYRRFAEQLGAAPEAATR